MPRFRPPLARVRTCCPGELQEAVEGPATALDDLSVVDRGKRSTISPSSIAESARRSPGFDPPARAMVGLHECPGTDAHTSGPAQAGRMENPRPKALRRSPTCLTSLPMRCWSAFTSSVPRPGASLFGRLLDSRPPGLYGRPESYTLREPARALSSMVDPPSARSHDAPPLHSTRKRGVAGRSGQRHTRAGGHQVRRSRRAPLNSRPRFVVRPSVPQHA